MTAAVDISDVGGDVATALDTIARCLNDAGIDTVRLDARLLVGAVTGESTAGLIARPERPLSAQESDLLSAMTARRCAREPMAHILGRREFWSLDFEVSADVLTPRPDSETLIEAAAQQVPAAGEPFRILDLGTGSGCLLLALLQQYPAASGVGVDISPAAVTLAHRNANRLGFGARSSFMVGDWTTSIAERFDIVVSNPPYIARGEIAHLAPEVARYEPHGALDGGDDGLDAYRSLLPLVSQVLAPGGTALFEIGAGQGEAVSSMAQACGLVIDALRADMAGIPRVAIMRQR